MEYPNTLTFKQLQAADSDHAGHKSFLYDIEVLHKGGRYIEAEKHRFLNKRLDEDADIYKIRLERFVYTNLLSAIVTKILGRFSTGEIFVSGLSDSFADDWSRFRECVDGHGRSDLLFLAEIFKSLLLYQDCYVQIDKPVIEAQPVNRAQEREMGLNSACLVLYRPSELLSCGDGWYKFAVLTKVCNPLGGSYHRATWRFVDSSYVVEYSALVEICDGKIAWLVDAEGERIKPVNGDTEISATKFIEHGFSSAPIACLKIPDDKYAAGQAYLKLKQYLNIENGVTDTALSAGYVQRVITPVQTKEDDYAVIDESSFKSDNAHVIRAQSFKFEEIAGTSIEKNLNFLDKIEAQIERLVCISAGSTTREALVQAAASKKMDVNDFELFLRSYGALLARFYQDILKLVAEAIGDTAAALNLSVSGLDGFDLDHLEDDIANALAIEPIKGSLSPIALGRFYNRISQGLNRNSSAEEQAEIASDITQPIE